MVYISMLRGINVSGQKRINMEELKSLYESLKFEKVITYIQSGNVIFESSSGDPWETAKKIEGKINTVLGYDVKVIIRTPADLKKIIKGNPFQKRDEKKLHVTFLSEQPEHIPEDDIEKAKDTSEEYLFSGKEVFLYCPNGYGISKLSNGFFERKLKVSATTRNWNTVNKLLELSRE